MKNPLLLLAFAAGPLLAADLGIFSATANIGNPPIAGATTYDPADQSYLVAGSGADVWGARDECHLAYQTIKGDFIATANVEIVGEITHPHQKAGWMVRASTAEDAAFVNLATHADGLAAMQWRGATAEAMNHFTSQHWAPKQGYQILQLERIGNRITARAAHPGEPLQEIGTYAATGLPDEVLIGWFVSSHDRKQTNHTRIWNVRIDRTVGPDALPLPTPEGMAYYNPGKSGWLGCRLETIDVFTGARKVIHTSTGRFEAPNWMPDGQRLLFNQDGKLYTIPVAGGVPVVLDTGSVTQNNNDHVISFDGKMLGISSNAGKGSAVYVLPLTGGEPKRLTEKVPSYLHGWNPNGKEVVFVANRNGKNYDIYSVPVAGGEEVNLTNITKGHVDGCEFSPDGKYIYYNGSQTGTMQLWRMNPDGSGKEQLTFDANNNWFPHVSPDGNWLAYISFGPTIEPGGHPSYKRVTLNLMPLRQSGAPRVIAYLYGGQGTINVPSWSHDSRHLAFVSNSGRAE